MRDIARRHGKKGDPELIAALAMGKTVREAASLAGLNEATAHRRTKDPDFKRQLSEFEDQMFRETTRMLARSTSGAVVTLVAVMKDGPPNAKVAAARAVLDQSATYTEKLSILERLADLEERSARMDKGKKNGWRW